MKSGYNRDISNIARELSQLDINSEKRRELIKTNYSCLAIFYKFPQALEKAVKEAKENNLKQDKAYEYLKKSFNKYDNKVAFGIASQRNYPFGINNNYNLFN